MKHPNGSEEVMSSGMFAQIVKIRNVPCTDNVKRTIRIGIPGSISTAPGIVKVKGKTVSGYVAYRSCPVEVTGIVEGWYFYATGKNKDVLPETPEMPCEWPKKSAYQYSDFCKNQG